MNETTKFVENFVQAVNVHKQDVDKDAQKVIVAVELYANNEMGAQGVINYFFADHGWKHSEQLSVYALFMLKQLKEERRKQFNEKEWDNMLVLLWTSIALHDIGMNDITSNEDELMEIIKKQAGRIDHVEKSGKWISQIIDHIEGKSKMEAAVDGFVNAWECYWSEEQQIDAITALRMVKDIVLMHGENRNWLSKEKMGCLDRDVFADIAENLSDIYKQIISYNEAILCLSDLLDIRPKRMNIFSNKSLDKYFKQMDEEQKRVTFEHWVSHNITAVSLKEYENDGYIVLEIYMYSVDSKMYLNNVLNNIYPNLGAINACLKWGNDDRLKNILTDFGYNGIKHKLRRQNARLWGEIHNKAINFELFNRKEILNINAELDGTSNVFINNIIHRWIENSWIIEKDIYYNYDFRNVFSVIQDGVALHLMYEKISGDIGEKSTGFYVKLLDKKGVSCDINDLFLIAVNAIFEISNKRSGIQEIKIVTKGDETFSALYHGEKTDKRTAYIAIVSNCFEDDLNKVVETVRQKNDNSFVIFISVAQEDEVNLERNWQKLEYALDRDKYEKIKMPLNQYAIKHWAKKEVADEKERRQVNELMRDKKKGIGEYLKQLKFLYDGIQAIEEKIADDLKQDKYGSLFILNLFEMISKNIDGRKEVQYEDLKYFYNEFCEQNRSKIYKMDDFKTSMRILLTLCEDVDGKIRLSEKNADLFKKLIIDSSREMNYGIKNDLFQMMIFFWLYNCRKVNFKSVCYREYLTYLSPKELCNYILNTNIALKERINISFETSEIIVEELKRNTDNNILKAFLKEYVNQLLYKRQTLTENEDIICFQAIYRIFRGILTPNMESPIDYIRNIIMETKSCVGYLGYIEGVCSANIPDSEKIKDKLNEFLEYVIECNFKSSDLCIKCMTYDILYNYERNELRKRYWKDSWENICASLHGKAELKKENEGILYYEWKEMREKFLYILNETSDSIRKRNKIDKKGK